LVKTDLDDFRANAAKLLESGESRGRHEAAERLVQLARGEFLVELRYEDWAAQAQSSVHAELRMHLLPLARGELDLPADMSIRAASALIVLDRFDEAAHLALVDRLLAAGRRIAARDALRRYALLLAQELEEDPTPELLQAYAAVRLEPIEVKQDLTHRENPLTFPARGS
jgi:DNA-binding SARP family transcriptional activator